MIDARNLAVAREGCTILVFWAANFGKEAPGQDAGEIGSIFYGLAAIERNENAQALGRKKRKVADEGQGPAPMANSLMAVHAASQKHQPGIAGGRPAFARLHHLFEPFRR